MRRTLVTAVALLMATTVWLGCGAEEPVAQQVEPEAVFEPVTDPASPAWSPETSDDDPAVATVDGVPIPRSLLQELIEVDGGKTEPAVLLERAIEVELLARRALELGYYQADIVQEAQERAMVQLLLKRRISDHPPEEFFNEELVRSVFYNPSVRVKFDHVDIFKVADAQYLCCPGAPGSCKTEEFEACMSEGEPKMREVQADLVRRTQGAESFGLLTHEWELDVSRLALKNYSFFYNVNLPHEEQKGYDIINENVARTTMTLEVGEISKPVQSENGWHIIYLVEHIPEEHRGPDDPEVRAQIIERLLPQRLKAEYGSWLRSLREGHRVVVFPERLNAFFDSQTRID